MRVFLCVSMSVCVNVFVCPCMFASMFASVSGGIVPIFVHGMYNICLCLCLTVDQTLVLGDCTFYEKLMRVTRPDTRPSVADGWAGAEMRVFPLFNSITTDRPTEQPTNRPTKSVRN